MMNPNAKYEAALGDMLTLLQQATARFFTNREVDFNKFRHYFTMFLSTITAIEEEFTQQQHKYAPCLWKLTQICSLNKMGSWQKDSIGASQAQSDGIGIQSKVSGKQALMAIHEEEDDAKKKRSGTAKGWRGQVVESGFRPMTSKWRNDQAEMPSQSFTGRSGTEYLTIPPSNKEDHHHYTSINATFNTIHTKPKRKSFYDDLERDMEVPFPVKLPPRRRKTLQKHWPIKIHNLL